MANRILVLAADRLAAVPRAADATSLAVMLRRVADCDRDAFEEVYRRTAAKLLGVCLQILRRRAEAEDVLQDVYCSVWRSASSFDRQRGSAMTWLITIARNSCVDRLRRSRSSLSASIELAGDVADPQPLSCEVLCEDEEHRMRRSLDRLNERDARALRMAFFGGSTYGDLAKAAEIPVGTMKSRLRRALLQLREGLS